MKKFYMADIKKELYRKEKYTEKVSIYLFGEYKTLFYDPLNFVTEIIHRELSKGNLSFTRPLGIEPNLSFQNFLENINEIKEKLQITTKKMEKKDDTIIIHTGKTLKEISNKLNDLETITPILLSFGYKE